MGVIAKEITKKEFESISRQGHMTLHEIVDTKLEYQKIECQDQREFRLYQTTLKYKLRAQGFDVDVKCRSKGLVVYIAINNPGELVYPKWVKGGIMTSKGVRKDLLNKNYYKGKEDGN